MPASGAIISTTAPAGDPPSRRNTCPDASIVNTTIDMLKSVRYPGFGSFALSRDWAHAPTAPTIIVVCGPIRISEAMSTTYDTDMLEPLAMGNWILKADVSAERRMRISSGTTGVNVARGTSRPKAAAPSAMTAMIYQRARAGRSLSKPRQVYRVGTPTFGMAGVPGPSIRAAPAGVY